MTDLGEHSVNLNTGMVDLPGYAAP